MTNCIEEKKKRFQELRDFAEKEKDDDLKFLLEEYDKELAKRMALHPKIERLRADTRYHKLTCAFHRREADQFIKVLQGIIFLDQKDGRFAEMCQEALRSYEERAGADESVEEDSTES